MDKKVALYTRINKKNDKFLKMVSKKAGVSRTEFLDSFFDFVRNNSTLLKEAQHFGKKTRNQIQGKSRSSS